MIISKAQYKDLILELFRIKKQAVALELVQVIADNLESKALSFYANGQLLVTLDQVINAILDDTLDQKPRIVFDGPGKVLTMPRSLVEERI